MTFWQRAPRQVYRVYGEDEYLDANDVQPGGDAQLEGDALTDGATRGLSLNREGQGSRSGRFIGLGLLLFVIAGALGLVISNVLHRQSATAPYGVTQNAEMGAEHRPSLGAHGEPEPVVRTPTAPASSLRQPAGRQMRASARLALGSRQSAGSPAVPALRTPSRKIVRLPPFASGRSGFVPHATHAGDEFDFER